MQNNSRERRYLKNELRASRRANGERIITGYAAKYGVISEDLGGFREVLVPGCFDLEASTDVVCNYDHDDCRMLGRTTSGTLQISADETGLLFECRAPNTSLGNDICELIERGDIAANSFAFVISDGGEEWAETEDGLPLRRITRCVIFDVSVVVHPAYPETELALRSLHALRDERKQPPPTPATVPVITRCRMALAERLSDERA